MKVQYWYRGEAVDDLRDLVLNHKFKPNWDYILNEYIPYQTHITGRTFFEEVSVAPTCLFEPLSALGEQCFNRDIFTSSFDDYLNRYDYDEKELTMAAVSGGVDSSVVALEIKPDVIYSGYYDSEEYNELEYSSLIADTTNSNHHKILLTEQDFIDNMYEVMDAICTPVGGMGSVMEYTTLKKALSLVTNINQVFFGNGGDEIFAGYHFNHFVKEFYERGFKVPYYMPNFQESSVKITENLIDFILVASMNRGPRSIMSSEFTNEFLLKKIDTMTSVISKLLYVNINITLPSLLHLNNQICKSLEIKGFNPIANEELVRAAKRINTPLSDWPKMKLRKINPDLPERIQMNFIKKGFPIPLESWYNVRDFFEVAYDQFHMRPPVTIEKIPFNGINRYTWAIFQAELCIRRFGL